MQTNNDILIMIILVLTIITAVLLRAISRHIKLLSALAAVMMLAACTKEGDTIYQWDPDEPKSSTAPLVTVIYGKDALGDITLYVPKEAVETYKATPTWKNFNVKPIKGTGIRSINEELRVKNEEFATAPGWYTLDGCRLDGKPAQRGIYIHGGRRVVIK